MTRTGLVPGVIGLSLLLSLAAPPVVATDSEKAGSPDAPKYFALPFEIDFDSGADNGDAVISRLIPVNSIKLSDKWRLMNIALFTIADAPGGVPGRPGNPESVPGPNVFGLGDLTDALLWSPTEQKGRKGVMWGIGAGFGVPIATDEVLGSGKWSAGPAFRLAYQPGAWHLALLAANRWSFAGDSSRADTNQLLIRGLVRRTIGRDWFFVYSPIITANWNASSDQRWLVPVGGGFGRRFGTGPTAVNVSVQAYANVVKPDGAPDSLIRLEVVFPIRLPDGMRRSQTP